MELDLETLQSLTIEPDWHELSDQVALSKTGDVDAQHKICGALMWAAFACPSAITAVYDHLFYNGVEHFDASGKVAEIPSAFWLAFAQTLEGPEHGYDAISITATVAALGGATNPDFYRYAEQAAVIHPGASGAATKEVPALLELSQLEGHDENSLGQTLYRMLVDNGYDAEVLDRDSIGLTKLPPATRYLNTRILQMHDVWHLLAGYQTTSMHEIAISAFQLAQFGHNYSAMFLATVSVMSQRNSPDAFNLMMLIFSEGWCHGRQTPALMDIDFEQVWDVPIDDLRLRHGIQGFAGSLPADLFEQLKAS